jgi:CRP-like cAMP-binding protein
MTAELISSEIFKKIPIFRGFSPAEWKRLLEIADMRDFAAGEVILAQGQRSQRLYVLLEGTCDVYHTMAGPNATQSNANQNSEPTTLATLEPFSNFGEMSFFHPAPHSASVRAKTAVKLLILERSKYDLLCQQEASAACKLALNTVESLAERLRRMDEWVDELVHRGQANQKIPEWNRLRATLFDGWKL